LAVQKRLDLTPLATDKLAFIQKLLKHPNGNPIQPHPTQIQVLQGIERTTVLLAGRQWGKSTLLGWDGTWFGCTHANRQIYCIAPSLDQSRIIFNEIASHFRKPPLSYLLDGKIVDYPFPHFKLINGTEYHGRGANSPQFIRGHRAHRVYGDEVAFIKDDVCEGVIEPMFTVTGQEPDSALILASTPFGQGYFFDTFQLGEQHTDGFTSFQFTSEDNPYADQRFLARQKARYGEDSLIWRTEYLAKFVDSDNAVIPWADIKWAYEHWPYESFPLSPETGHKYVQGVDLANRRDWFVASVLDTTNSSQLALVRLDRMQQKDYPTYKAAVRSNYRSYNHPRTLLDATSLGESVVQDLADINAEGYTFGGNTAKAEVVHELKRLFSERRLVIPNQRDLLDELRYFEYNITPAKVVRMEAAKGHDDIFMSLSLAAHLALLPRELGFFMPVDFTPAPPPTPTYDPVAAAFQFED
jgi:hypothetical protein